MGLKNILVHQDQTKASRARLELAIYVCKTYDAHLKVIFARGGWQQSISEHAIEAKKQFDELTAEIDAEWIEGDAYNPDKNLIDQLKGNQKNLEYYKQNAIPQSALLLKQSQGGFREGEIGYIEYVQGLNRSLTIRSNYLAFVNTYNQTLIKIEELIKNK